MPQTITVLRLAIDVSAATVDSGNGDDQREDDRGVLVPPAKHDQLEVVQRLNALPSDTITDTKPDEARVAVGSDAPETARAPDLSGALVRAGDRGRTGDVQLGKLAFYH